ncbi:MAG: hypothetical protein CMN28_10855 [Salinisphaeraceae bacterium]|nr:hypothetical protein [Salinisphaeraceae bacterium]
MVVTSLTNRLGAAVVGAVSALMLGIAALPPIAQADDIDIYTQAPATDSSPPLVVLTVDLNLDPTEIVCSNVLADPSTLVGEPLCETLQQVTVLPVLEAATGLEIGALTDALLGENSVVGGLLGLVGNLAGVSLDGLAGELQGILGQEGGGTSVSLTQLDVVRLLLYRVLHQLVGVRLAIMANNANTCDPASFASPRSDTVDCSNGAFVLLDATELLEDSLDDTVDQVIARLGALEIGSFDTEADATPPFQGKELYYELVRYLKGEPIYNAPLTADNGLPTSADPAAVSNGRYNSPLADGACNQISVINLMFTDSQADSESDADILADASFSGANVDGGELTWPEMITHLATQGVAHNGGNYRVRSSFLVNGLEGGVGGLLSNLTGTVMNLPLAINPLAVDFARSETFVPVQSTTASFGGPQTVFSLSSRGEAMDRVYTGYFKPDPDRRPAWRGNLKRLALDSGEDGDVVIRDALGLRAVNASGELRMEALSFWTDPGQLPSDVVGALDGRDGNLVDRGGAGMKLIPPYVQPSDANPPPGTPGSSAAGGPIVYYQASGDTAKHLRIANLNLDDTTLNDVRPALAVSSRLEAAELVAFARGYQSRADELGGEAYGGFLSFLGVHISGLTALIEATLENLFESLFCNNLLGFLGIILGTECDAPGALEPGSVDWAMGDILHSHPLAIDYGGSRGIRIFAGTNLGFLHQFRDEAAGGTTFGGQEVWRFAPRHTLKYMQNWRANTATAASRPYGVDGAATAWVHDADGDGEISSGGDDKVWLFFGLRRGGKAYYALDVTNPDQPPTGLWYVDNTQAGFGELGMTFSTPRFARLRISNDGGQAQERPVLLFGGGYNGGYTSAGTPLGKDAKKGSNFDASQSAGSSYNRNQVGDDDDSGHAIFVVDAETGELIWKARGGSSTGATTAGGAPVFEHASMDDGIASDLTVVDVSGDGYADRIYVGDTGGRVWRADIGHVDPAEWQAAPIASLGRHGADTVSDDRRFFERPDVVRVRGTGSSFFAVVIGSGNRADPLNLNTENYLFVLKDDGLLDPAATPTDMAGLADFNSNCSGGDCASLLDADFAFGGWKMRLGPGFNNERQGEKALSSPFTVAGKVLFTSYVPAGAAADACSPQEGRGRLYAVDLRTGEPVVAEFSNDAEPSAAGSIDYDRSTWLSAAGIPATLNYIKAQTFLTSDYGIAEIDHASQWRTYWRERFGEH